MELRSVRGLGDLAEASAAYFHRADDFSPFSIEVGEQGPAAGGLESLLKRPLKQLTSTCWSCLLFCKIPCNFSVGIALCTLLLLGAACSSMRLTTEALKFGE